jgi:hypothetical protein
MPLYTVLHNSLNALVQTANKMGLPKKQQPVLSGTAEPFHSDEETLTRVISLVIFRIQRYFVSRFKRHTLYMDAAVK